MRKFKVGDTIRVSKNNNQNPYRNGAMGTIKNMDDRLNYLVEFPASESTNKEFGFTETYVEKIELFKPKPFNYVAVLNGNGDLRLIHSTTDIKEDAVIYKIIPYCSLRKSTVMRKTYIKTKGKRR